MVEALPLSTDLVQFYRTRLLDGERKLQDLLRRFDEANVNATKFAQLQGLVRQREAEIVELQRALSDSHQLLFQERGQLLQVVQALDSAKLQQMEDRKKVQELLALSGAASHDITYFREQAPSIISHPRSLLQHGLDSAAAKSGGPSPGRPRVSGSSGRPGSAAAHGSTSDSPVATVSATAKPASSPGGIQTTVAGSGGDGTGGERVLRTVVLPDEQRGEWGLVVQSLRTQLEEQRAYYEAQIAALQEDRRIRREEELARCRSEQDRLAFAEKGGAELQFKLQQLTKEYLALEQATRVEQRELFEKNEVLKADNERLRLGLDEIRRRAAAETKAAMEAADEQAQAYIGKYQTEYRAMEEDKALLNDKHEAERAEYEHELQTARAKHSALLAKYHELNRRRNAEVEGFGNDVALLRRQVKDLEAKLTQYRLRELERRELSGMTLAH